MGVMSTMITRAFRYCSTEEKLENEIDFVTETFINSGYSVSFVEETDEDCESASSSAKRRRKEEQV